MKPYYQDSFCTIYHGDCREILPLIPKVELVLTDPPFSALTHKNSKSNRDGLSDHKAIDFHSIDFAMIESLFSSVKCSGWFIGFMDYRHIAKLEEAPPNGWRFIRFGVWVKTNPMPQISADRPANGWDGIAYLYPEGKQLKWNGGGKHGNWIGPVITNGDHPTQKPIDFMRTLIERHSNTGELALDPFMGSGTTLRAAKDMQRHAIGIDLEEKYCEVAARRLQQEVFDFGKDESNGEKQPKQAEML